MEIYMNWRRDSVDKIWVRKQQIVKVWLWSKTKIKSVNSLQNKWIGKWIQTAFQVFPEWAPVEITASSDTAEETVHNLF